MLALLGSSSHMSSRFPGLRIKHLTSPSHMSHWVMQWDLEDRLSEYSDRIVQDSHLIPSSYLYTHLTQHSLHDIYYSACRWCCQLLSKRNMCSLLCHFRLHDLPCFYLVDLVTVFQSTYSVGDHQKHTGSPKSFHRLHHGLFGLGIECGSGFIQN